MRRPPVHRLLVLTILCLLTATQARANPVFAAAPRLVMVYGGSLPRPVLLTDWTENGAVLGIEDPTVTPAMLTGRPSFQVALFWGAGWDEYARDQARLNALRPDDANQHGELYPATGSDGAFLALRAIPGPGSPVRRLTADGVAVLTRHGIPLTVDASSVSSRTVLLVAAGMGLCLAGVVVLLKRAGGANMHSRFT